MSASGSKTLAEQDSRREQEDAMAETMQATAFPKGQDAWTKPQANALLRAVEDMFHRRDLDALVEGFTEDCIVRFAEQPERRGRAALRELCTWTDRETGKAMAGRGVEVWAMRDGMIAVWDAAFNIWEQGGERKSPVM